MAISQLGDIILDEVLMQTAFINRIVQNSMIFNAVSNGAITMDTQHINGYFPKSTQIDQPEDLITDQDITSNATIADKKVIDSQVGGVKLFQKIGPLAYTLNYIKEKRWSNADLSMSVGSMFADNCLKWKFKLAINTLTSVIGGDANKFKLTTDRSAKVLYEAPLFYEKDEERWICSLTHTRSYVEMLKEGYGKDNPANATLIDNKESKVYGLNRPLIRRGNSELAIADVDPDTADAQKGNWILFLPREAARVTITKVPTIVTDLITDKEQIGIRFRAEQACVIKIKGHEYTPTGKAPTLETVGLAASWTDRSKSLVNSCGFGLKIQDA